MKWSSTQSWLAKSSSRWSPTSFKITGRRPFLRGLSRASCWWSNTTGRGILERSATFPFSCRGYSGTNTLISSATSAIIQEGPPRSIQGCSRSVEFASQLFHSPFIAGLAANMYFVVIAMLIIAAIRSLTEK